MSYTARSLSGWLATFTLPLASCAATGDGDGPNTMFNWKAAPIAECSARIVPDITDGIFYLYAPAGSKVVVAFDTDVVHGGDAIDDLRTYTFEEDTPLNIGPVSFKKKKPVVHSCDQYPLKDADQPYRG